MNSVELDTKIEAFLERKNAKFPSLGLVGHDESRTVKFPAPHQVPHAAH